MIGYKEAVKHIMETYEKRFGLKYPFKAADGRFVKWMLINYGLENTCALWTSFLRLKKSDICYFNKNGVYVERQFSLMVFVSKVMDLIEKGEWKQILADGLPVPKVQVELKEIEPSNIA